MLSSVWKAIDVIQQASVFPEKNQFPRIKAFFLEFWISAAYVMSRNFCKKGTLYFLDQQGYNIAE